ncbi:MAG TPA: arsenate reductase ArsC [Usitatibacter sp.]|nr:arsenate reductase ArsC [Usitatibacter sp.]
MTMDAKPYDVLFLCTGNSARSILAEAMMNRLGRGRFRAYSAGSHPGGKVNPWAIELLRTAGMPTSGLRSKSWDEFARPGAPAFDFIITVCDNAANEVCPVWPGNPTTAHWGVPDPAAVEGGDEEKRAAFRSAMATLRRRIELLAALPLDKLDRLSIQEDLRRIARE